MKDNLQYDLFGNTWEQRFDKWVHTPGGGWVANHCIRYAYAFKREGKHRSMKLIWELVREDLRDFKVGKKIPRVDGYAMNDGFTASMARFIESREKSLEGYFTKHGLSASKKGKKMLVIPLQQTA